MLLSPVEQRPQDFLQALGFEQPFFEMSGDDMVELLHSHSAALAAGPALTGGSRFDRPGRTTLVLVPSPAGPEAWIAVHSHMSLAKGVPADSHAKRAVKAR